MGRAKRKEVTLNYERSIMNDSDDFFIIEIMQQSMLNLKKQILSCNCSLLY